MSKKTWVYLKAALLFLVLFGGAKAFVFVVQGIVSKYDVLIAWANHNDKLSGWAQAVGGTIGILIAIFVPSYQRYLQRLDHRREEAERQRSLAMNCYFLLCDTSNYFSRLIEINNAPRGRLSDHFTVSSLLERIHALESKEVDWQRTTMLYHARNFLLLGDGLTKAGDLEQPLSTASKKLLTSYKDHVDQLSVEAKHDSDYRGHASEILKRNIFARAVSHLPKNRATLPNWKR